MIVEGGARPLRLLWRDRWTLLTLVLLAVATELVEPYVAHLELFSIVYVGVFSTALSIFLVFRFNEAYERWWEARKLWGALVNESRDFARQALTLLDADAARADGPRLVRRQIAFVHGLRIHLRERGSPAGRAQLEAELRRVVPDEADALMGHANPLNALLAEQTRTLRRLLGGSTGDRVLLARFDETLGRLHDIQGACERIKNTVFPESVSVITRLLVWGLVLLLLIATVGPDGRGGVAATVAVCIMAMGYLWIDSLGQALKNPFENQPNDTPMTALSVAIERDLRDLLGERELPEPVQPVGGVLM